MAEQHSAPRILRLPAVIDRVGLQRTAIYELIKAGDFPRGVALSSKARGWPEQSISEWIEGRIRKAKADTKRVPA